MYVLVLVILTTAGAVDAKPLAKTDTLETCEKARIYMLSEKPPEVSADAICVKLNSI